MGQKSGNGSTGNGYHHTMWTQNIEDPVGPRFSNLVLQPGSVSPADMVTGMDEGVIVHEVIGFHSGNILAGEYNMGVGTGAYVKDGRIVGRCMDTMVAGNVYEDFYRIKALGSDLERNELAYSPSMLIEGVAVSGG